MAIKNIQVEIPTSIIRAYVPDMDNPSTARFLKETLQKSIPEYFDKFGDFKGITFNFTSPMFIKEGTKRVSTRAMYMFQIDDATDKMLNAAQSYTNISKKNLAETIILKEILEGGKNAEDRPVPDEQGTAAGD